MNTIALPASPSPQHSPPPLVSYAMQITFAHLRRMTEGNNGNVNGDVAVRIRNA